MKRILSALALTLLSTSMVTAQKYIEAPHTADKVVVLWDNSSAPHSSEAVGDEYTDAKGDLKNTQQTVMYIYAADRKTATGQCVVIVPGGGHSKVVMRKGYALAEWLKEIGITAVVLKYRLPNGHPDIPLEDSVETLRYMRSHADEFGIDPAKVGICGGSAGGHLAAQVATFTSGKDIPAFAVLFYPVISAIRYPHQGTFRRMLGDRYGEEEVMKYYSLDTHVSPTTPPTIIFHSDDDPTVPPQHATIFYDALKEHGVRATMYIFPSGGHGWVGSPSFRYNKEYKEALADWLKTLG